MSVRPQVVLLFGGFAPSLINFRGPLIADMVARGHRVFAMAPDMDAGTQAALRELGATPVQLPLGRASLNPLSALGSRRALRRRLHELRPDVIIAYTIKPILLAGPEARRQRVRFVPLVTGLGYAFAGGASLKGRLLFALAVRLYRRALQAAAVVLFQNPDDVADFRRWGILSAKTRTGLINGSGVDLQHFGAAAPPPEPVFLMVARLLRAKGVSEFAQAAARLKRERPQVRIRLVGWRDDSPDAITAGELEAMQRQGVEYVGRLDDVRPELRTCSVYVLPSFREGTPRSVLEAMAVGRAVITTDAPGCRETVVEGDNGLLVPPRDAEGLYAAMLRLADDGAERARMGRRSRELAEQKYDVRQVNAALLAHAGL